MPSSTDAVADEGEEGTEECHPQPSGGRWKGGALPAFRCLLGWAVVLAVIMNTHQPRKSLVPTSRHFTDTDGLPTEAQGPET